MKLADRYIHAVTRLIPEEKRNDAAQELRTKIESMIEQKGSYSEETEEQVLRELGNPRLYAEGYLDRKQFLIGPELYGTYLSLLKIVIPIAVIASLVGSSIDYVTNGKSVLDYIAGCFLGILTAGVTAFGWITAIFAVFERKGKEKVLAEIAADWEPRQLPEPREPQKSFNRAGTFVGIGFTILFLIMLNGFTKLLGFYYMEGGSLQIVPLLNEEAFRQYLPAVNGMLILQLLLTISKLLYKKWTYPIAAANLLLNLLGLVLAYAIVGDTNLININAFLQIPGITDALMETASAGLGQLAVVLKVLFPIVFAMDTFEGFFNAYRNGKKA